MRTDTMTRIRIWLHQIDTWIIGFGQSAADIDTSYNACI